MPTRISPRFTSISLTISCLRSSTKGCQLSPSRGRTSSRTGRIRQFVRKVTTEQGRKTMDQNLEKVKLLARDLRNGKQFPRSPRQTLAGYVLAARAVDKCRAVLVGWEGEYHSNCPLDQRWLKFTEIDYDDFRAFGGTGATDDEIAT